MNDSSCSTPGFVFAPRRDGVLLPMCKPHHESCDHHQQQQQQQEVSTIANHNHHNRHHDKNNNNNNSSIVAVCCACRLKQRSVVSISDVFGRGELWSALRRACPHGSGCSACQAVLQWIPQVPRALIQARVVDVGTAGESSEKDNDNNNHQVWAWVQRKKYCYISNRLIELARGGDTVEMNATPVKQDDNDETCCWLGPTVLEPGDILQFHRQLEGETSELMMEFQLCRIGIEVQQQRGDAGAVQDLTVDLSRKRAASTNNGKAEKRQRLSNHGMVLPKFDLDVPASDDDRNDPGGAEEHGVASQPESQPIQCVRKVAETLGCQTVQIMVDQSVSPGAVAGADSAPTRNNNDDIKKICPGIKGPESAGNSKLVRQELMNSPLLNTTVSLQNTSTTGSGSPSSFVVEDRKTQNTMADQAATDQVVGEKLPDTMRSSNVRAERPFEPPGKRTIRENDERPPTEKVALEVAETKKASSAPLPANPVIKPDSDPACFGVSAQLLRTSEQKQSSTAKPAAMTVPKASLGSTDNCSRAIPNPSSRNVTDSSKASVVSSGDVESAPDEQFVLYICPLGKDLQGWRYDGVAPLGIKEKARQRGAVVLDSFKKSEAPFCGLTHLVISFYAADDEVPSNLGFESPDEMVEWLENHGVACVKPEWITEVVFTRMRKPPPLGRPTRKHMRGGFLGQHKRIRPNLDGVPSSGRHAEPQAHRNIKLSELFRKISKRYQECPLDENEEKKSYAFQKACGRLRYLDFEVTKDPDSIKRLRKVKYFGPSMVDVVKDYFARGDGTCGRLRMLETEKDRVGIREVKKIWGVGQVKAWELVRDGYRRIGDVRRALEEGRLKLDRNQLIGVKYYEDMQEKMTRSEVEAIAQIVAKAVRDRFPLAEINIMGSYRRGKEMCGDADIIIWHPEYVDEVPPKALGKIVDQLCKDGHIVHHLTFIAGMDPKKFETLDPNDARKLVNPETFGRVKEKASKTEGSMWMGVFKSPMVKGLHRHVDIKFYPYSERVYATLYFTGNGYFNRSMRLWATKKHKLKLSDHGLFTELKLPALENHPNSEKEVFDRLGLKWKEPHQRNYFDDVISSTPGEEMAVIEMDFSRED